MGRISKFICPSCNMAWELPLGHGMRHATLGNVLNVFSEETRQKILADTEGEKAPVFEFNYCPAVCPQCGKMIAVPVIYLPRTGKTYVTACPDCGKEVKVFTKEDEILCPHCGEKTLQSDDVGRWD